MTVLYLPSRLLSIIAPRVCVWMTWTGSGSGYIQYARIYTLSLRCAKRKASDGIRQKRDAASDEYMMRELERVPVVC